MSYLVLARKWRPMRFEDLVGQDHVARTLGNAIKSGRVAHAFLFTGVRGVGKTTSARILAKALNCMGDPDTTPPGTDPGPTVTPCLKCAACLEIAQGTDLDVREIDGASYNGVDEVRKLQDSIPYRPARDRSKIFIVDEVHMLSQSAWNAFLKTLEEPPPHVKFIFATTEVHKVPVTILSRVQRFDFKLISAQVIAERLRYVLSQEKIQADDAAISIVAREAAGSMRDAMSLLDQLIAWGGEELRGEDVARVLGVASHAVLYELGRALVGGDAARCLEIVGELSDLGHDLPHVARDLLALLRDLVVAKTCADPSRLLDLPDDAARDVSELARGADADDLLRLHQGFAQGFDEVVRSGQPRAALEMLLVRLSRRPPLVPIDHLLSRLAQFERRLTQGAVPGRPAPSGAAPRSPAPISGGGAPAPSARPREPQSPPNPRPERADERKEPPRVASENGSAERRPEAPPPSPSGPPPPQPRNGAGPRSSAAPRAPAAPLDLDEALRAIVARIAGERLELAAKLEHGVLLEAGPGRLLFGWAPDSLFGDLVSTPENTTIIERAASTVLGGPCKVQHERDSARAAGKKTLSRLEAEAREARTRAAYEKARQHPRIAEAVEILGGRLKDLKLAKGS
ncbi:MAG TPA: DNA polymerase III subunit gamma/tau [Polyangiaceae bacterium]|nr:DNA polymerase III subunit gamma/tau [Polyangiaceae bacterium]